MARSDLRKIRRLHVDGHHEWLVTIDYESGATFPRWTREVIDGGVWPIGEAFAIRDYVRLFSDSGYWVSHVLIGVEG